jgi:hypothetical protein
MQRRELLRSLVGLPLVSVFDRNRTHDAAAVALPLNNHLLIFIDSRSVDPKALAEALNPFEIDYSIATVKLRQGQSIHDAVQIYKVSEEKESG